MRKNEIEATEKVSVIMTLLMNILFLTSAVGVIWIVQLILSQAGQLNDLVGGFNLI